MPPTQLPETLSNWLISNNILPPYTFESLSGGCINENQLLRCGKERFFIKTHSNAPLNFFKAEHCGLLAIQKTKTFRTPNVFFESHEGLIMEYIPKNNIPLEQSTSAWTKTAELLSELHSNQSPTQQFGFEIDTYCGLTKQNNQFHSLGVEFFYYQRLLTLAQQALETQLLPKKRFDQIKQLLPLLTEDIDDEMPSLVHGDLWTGNLFFDGKNPVLIDPAIHYGWPETDLAMTSLFGGFPQEFYQHYSYLNPQRHNWQIRSHYYDLYHMLNHLILFGGSYLQSVNHRLNKIFKIS